MCYLFCLFDKRFFLTQQIESNSHRYTDYAHPILTVNGACGEREQLERERNVSRMYYIIYLVLTHDFKWKYREKVTPLTKLPFY